MSDDPQDDQLEALEFLVDAHIKAIRTCELGVVQSYDLETQRAVIQPIMQTRNNRDEYDKQSPIKNCPVRFMDFGGFVIHGDLQPGVVGTIYYSERDIEAWFETGNTDIKPKSTLRFDENDAFFVPGFQDDKHPLPDTIARAGELVLSSKDGQVQIRVLDGKVIIDAPEIVLGEGATQFAALADKVDKFIETIDGVLGGFTPVPGDGGAALKAAWIAAKTTAYFGGVIGSVKAALVKVK